MICQSRVRVTVRLWFGLCSGLRLGSGLGLLTLVRVRVRVSFTFVVPYPL